MTNRMDFNVAPYAGSSGIIQSSNILPVVATASYLVGSDVVI